MLYLKPLASVVELHIATPWGSRRGQGGRLLLKLPLDLWSNTCARGYCICFLSHYFNPLWNGNSHSKSTINNDSHLLQPLWIPQILCEMEILIQSLLLTMILTYFNHLELNNISELWNVHNKHVIWNLNMDNHMINSGKKQPINKAPWSSHQWKLRNSRVHPRSSSHWNEGTQEPTLQGSHAFHNSRGSLLYNM